MKPQTIQFDAGECPRCPLRHGPQTYHLMFQPICIADRVYDYWSQCPSTRDPILLLRSPPFIRPVS